jgi:putative restriction endonuclease
MTSVTLSQSFFVISASMVVRRAFRSTRIGTAPLTSTGVGATVSILHTGRHYPDDLSDEGVIYHYPSTSRPPGRDAAEVAATKETRSMGVPVFVILRGERAASRRRVRLGWVEDWDDASRQFLILFGDSPPAPPSLAEVDAPFVLQEDRAPRRLAHVQVRAGQQRFRFSILKQYGCKCAVCPTSHPQLIQAAHICGKATRGSDDWRNGILLCATHHSAFDAHLFFIEPGTLAIRFAPEVTAVSIGVTATRLNVLKNAPHEYALAWRAARNPSTVAEQLQGSDL